MNIAMSQSLLRQVCIRPQQPMTLVPFKSLNPFFVRSAFVSPWCKKSLSKRASCECLLVHHYCTCDFAPLSPGPLSERPPSIAHGLRLRRLVGDGSGRGNGLPRNTTFGPARTTRLLSGCSSRSRPSSRSRANSIALCAVVRSGAKSRKSSAYRTNGTLCCVNAWSNWCRLVQVDAARIRLTGR